MKRKAEDFPRGGYRQEDYLDPAAAKRKKAAKEKKEKPAPAPAAVEQDFADSVAPPQPTEASAPWKVALSCGLAPLGFSSRPFDGCLLFPAGAGFSSRLWTQQARRLKKV